MKRMLVLFALVACIVVRLPVADAQAAGNPAAPADLVQQVQAADLLADLITYTVDRTQTRISDAQAYLAQIGKQTEFEGAAPKVAEPRPLNYMLLFKGSLALVEGEGQKYADQSVKDEPTAQLYQDLTAAQYYNMHEFLHFNQLREQFGAMKAYLQSIGKYDEFAKGSEAETASANSGAAQAAPATPEAVAKRLGEMISFIKETAGKEAESKGMSETEFEQQWPEQVKAYRDQVMAKIDGSEPGSGGFGQSQLAGSTAPPPAVAPQQPLPQSGVQYVTPPQDLGANRQLPVPVRSPYTNADYRSKDMSLWDMWDYSRRY